MAADDGSGDNKSVRPLVWVIIPLLLVCFASLTTVAIFIRRRRRRSPDYATWWSSQRRVLAPDGTLTNVPRGGRSRRRALWAGMASREEGLNELGQAPPPYVKNHSEDNNRASIVSSGNGGNGGNGGEPATELTDLEAGPRPPEYNHPPEYPAEPPPAVTTESRRSTETQSHVASRT